MDNFFRELWWDGISPREECLKENVLYAETVRIRKEHLAEILGKLDEETRLQVHALVDEMGRESSLLAEAAFKKGFLLGGRIMLEALGK